MDITQFPNSLPEKEKSFKEEQYHEHWMYVGELKELLDHLKPDDWLTPNTIGNLAIGRGEDNTIGAINFFSNTIEFFNGEEDISPFPRGPFTEDKNEC
jgi:hypothetical protein